MNRNRREIEVSGELIRSSGQSGPVRMRMRQTAPNEGVLEIGVDYTLAQIPERAYYADYCSVERSRVGFTLTFGKLAAAENVLRTKIEVVFPAEMFQRQLWGTTGSLRETLNRVVADKKLGDPGRVKDTEKVQTFRSNNVFMAVWGEEGVLDFYYISPRDYFLSRARGGSADIGLEPVVRVVLDSAVMKEFFDKCGHFVDASLATVQSDETPEAAEAP